MNKPRQAILDIVHKLPELDAHLIQLLESLTDKEWHAQTVAKLWTVKDVAAHLLDGNIRVLSGLRDGYLAPHPPAESYQELVDYLNTINADWVKAMKRVSPNMLVQLLKITSAPYYDYYASLDPLAPAVFSVAWAGESESLNWMHIAREYTEKFLHQQQIRNAVGRQGLISDDFYFSFLDICMYALPFALRDIQAESGTTVTMSITGNGGGAWSVKSDGKGWQRTFEVAGNPTAEVTLDGCEAWKLFSKSIRPEDLDDKMYIKGDQRLGQAAVEMVSFMA